MNAQLQSTTERKTARLLGNSPISELRAKMASCFAAEIAAVTPEVCAVLQEQFKKCADTEERIILIHLARALASQRDQFAAQIDRRVRYRFDAKFDVSEDASSHTGQFSRDAVLLFEELGMHEEFELEQCVGQLRKECQAELFAMTVMLGKMLGRGLFVESHNPVFPRVLLRALQDALQDIGCDVRARRFAFRAYSPRLAHIIARIYRHVVEAFTQAETGRAVFEPGCTRNRPSTLSANNPPSRGVYEPREH